MNDDNDPAEERLPAPPDAPARTGQLPQGLPPDASRRLAELEDRPGHKGMFTSDLSVNEFLLIKEVGFHPLGFVMGSSIYHLGIQTRKWSQSQELSKLTEAMYEARQLAMDRMDAEATELGADGVVGVRLDVNYYEWGSDTAEFIAVGTAVKAEDGRSYRNRQGKPFTSDLSGQDFWVLMQTGHVPLGLVMGTCVYHIAHRGLGQTLRSTGRNAELPNFTQALYEARELAMTRMQDEANELEATGIVGVRLEEKSHMWGDHTIEFLSLGTAVARSEGDFTIPQPKTIISLDG
ncbi:MAG TPA: heavy metal-binding domain-containing protein [Acidimicrobiales bacterium]|nr:heavy metal-binding domain-containing protein [Acidimicrobiales bacterium]